MPDAPRRLEGSHRGEAVDLDWRSVAALAGSIGALLLLAALLRSVPRTLAGLGVGSILALGLNPLVSAVARRLRGARGAALALVGVGFLAAVAVIAVVLIPPAARQVRDLGRDIPGVVDDLSELPVVGGALAQSGTAERIERTVEELPARLLGENTPLFRIGRRAADGLVAGMVTLLFALTLLLDGDRLLRAAHRVVPPRHRRRAERLADLSYRVVGRYVAGSLMVAAVAGVCVLIAGLVLGVPLAPLLALWVMVWNLVPQIGGAAGGIPFVVLGFTQGAATGLACAAFFVVYLQLENNVLGPLLVGQAVKLSPPATMTAALIGVSAGGVVGALLAVPLAGATKAVYLELRPPELGPDLPAPDGAPGAATASP